MTEVPDKRPLAEALAACIEPDAHGQAALLLSESILHALVEANALSTDEALSVIQTACEVKVEVAQRNGESSARMEESLGLLQAIRTSFNGYPG